MIDHEKWRFSVLEFATLVQHSYHKLLQETVYVNRLKWKQQQQHDLYLKVRLDLCVSCEHDMLLKS